MLTSICIVNITHIGIHIRSIVTMHPVLLCFKRVLVSLYIYYIINGKRYNL